MNSHINMQQNAGNLLVSGEDFFNLEDAILLELGDTVFKLTKTFGTKWVQVRTSIGWCGIRRMPQDPEESFYPRIMDLIDWAKCIAESTGIDYNEIVPYIFIVDGWSWNETVFHSPVWMNGIHELSIDVAKRKTVLSWLSGSSLEIKLKLKKDQEEYLRSLHGEIAL